MFGDIRGSVGRYDPWGIKATGFAVTTKINHYAAVTLLRQCQAYVYGGSRVPGSWRSPSGSEAEVDVAEVGAPEGKKVGRTLLRKAKQFLIL